MKPTHHHNPINITDINHYGPVVYTALNRSRRPIYIGATKHLIVRLGQHATDAEHNPTHWLHRTTHIDHQRYETMHEALLWEAEAIFEQRPKGNTVHKDSPRLRHRSTVDHAYATTQRATGLTPFDRDDWAVLADEYNNDHA